MRPLRAGPIVLALCLPCAAFAGRIAVKMDARLELAGAAQALSPGDSSPDGFAAPDIPYARAVEAALTPFKDHPAVRINAEPKILAFNFSDRSQLLLRLSTLPELSQRLTVQYALADRAGGPENMRLWLTALRDLSKASRFPEIFARESGKLEPAVARFRERERKQDYLGTIEAYAGLPLLGTYTVNLTPFQLPGGVANAVSELDDGSMEIASVVGPDAGPDGLDFWSKRVPGTLWHESAHGVLDGLSDIFAEIIDRSSAAHATIGWACYGTWQQCVKEHFVRAVMIRLIAREISEEAAEEQLRFEKEEHYPYLRALLAKLKIYERRRDLYPTLADYYPRLLEVFPAAPRAGPRPEPTLSEPQRHRTRRLALSLPGRVKSAQTLALARRFTDEPAQIVPGPTPPPTARPSGPLPEGLEAFRAGHFEDALKSFDESLRASPDDIPTLMSRGVVLQALSRRTQALASYDRAVTLAEAGGGPLRGMLPDALTSRASILLDLGRRERAREDLRRALAVSADDWSERAAVEARLMALERP